MAVLQKATIATCRLLLPVSTGFVLACSEREPDAQPSHALLTSPAAAASRIPDKLRVVRTVTLPDRPDVILVQPDVSADPQGGFLVLSMPSDVEVLNSTTFAIAARDPQSPNRQGVGLWRTQEAQVQPVFWSTQSSPGAALATAAGFTKLAISEDQTAVVFSLVDTVYVFDNADWSRHRTVPLRGSFRRISRDAVPKVFNDKS